MDGHHRTIFDVKLKDMAREKCPRGFWFEDSEVRNFFAIIRQEGTREQEKETSQDNVTTVRLITYSCPADATLCVYTQRQVKDGAIGGGIVGGAGGTAGGAVIGAVAGSVVPVVGTVIGGVIGGVIGFVAGGVLGSATGAGVGKAVSNAQYYTITAKEVFNRMPGYRNSSDGKTVYCEL